MLVWKMAGFFHLFNGQYSPLGKILFNQIKNLISYGFQCFLQSMSMKNIIDIVKVVNRINIFLWNIPGKVEE